MPKGPRNSSRKDILFTPELVERIDRLAKANHISFSDQTRMLLSMALQIIDRAYPKKREAGE
jgi:hypothetical protein